MSDVEHKYWAVMYNKDGHISMTPSDGKPTPEGTTVSSSAYPATLTFLGMPR